MRPTRMAPVVGFSALALAAPTSSAAAAHAAEGRELTQSACGPCHAVSPDSREAPILRPPASSLLDVVRRSSFSEGFLRRFLASGHGRNAPPGATPHPALTDEQTDAVVAYILSLKTGK